MKRIEREILAALDTAGPKSRAAAIYEIIVKRRLNAMPFGEFYTLLDRLARAPEGMIAEMTTRNRRVFWITKEGRQAMEDDK